MLVFDDKKIRASRLEMMIARIFGRKKVLDGYTYYFYRNRVYVFSSPAG
jgi:hypothetical protein